MVKGNPASIHVDKVLQEIEDQELLNAIYFNRKIPSNTYDRAINEIKEALNF
ncbi:hypothetical protein XMA152_002183 [Marinobacterium sp. xm-a-152]|nr:hypothetical protein [Marinobacterium sp. xm-a-152]